MWNAGTITENAGVVRTLVGVVRTLVGVERWCGVVWNAGVVWWCGENAGVTRNHHPNGKKS